METAATPTLNQLLADERFVALHRALPGAELYFVGGCVRDALRGLTPKDLDFACALEPDALTAQLTAAGMYVIPTGLRHQTVTVIALPETSQIEITTFRGPGMSPAGGVVKGNSIEEDLAYRDFTVNSLALSCTGKLIDPNNGAADIDSRLLRTVGNSDDRFKEDPLRVWRLVRFACSLQFAIDPSTETAAAKFAEAATKVSIERIRDEFNKIMVSPEPVRGLRLLLKLGVLAPILPEVASMEGFEQNKFHHLDLLEHTFAVVEKTEPILELRLSALLHDIGKIPTLTVSEPKPGETAGDRHFYLHEAVGADMTGEIMERMRYSNQQASQVGTLVRTHMRPVTAGPGGLRRLLRDTEEVFDLWRALKEADASSTPMDPEELRTQLAAFDEAMVEIKKGPNVSPLKNLAIGGQELIELGMTPGPQFGVILRALHERVLDNPELNTREALLGLVNEIFGSESR